MGILERTVDALSRLCVAETEAERQKAIKAVRELLELREQGTPTTEKDPDTAIRTVLLKLGVPDKLIGHRYLVTAIALTVNDPTTVDSMTKGLYPAVAGQHGTNEPAVERAIRHAIEVAWDRGDLDTLQRFFGYTVSNTKGKPTNGEFIARVANVVRQRMKVVQ